MYNPRNYDIQIICLVKYLPLPSKENYLVINKWKVYIIRKKNVDYQQIKNIHHWLNQSNLELADVPALTITFIVYMLQVEYENPLM